MKETIAVKRYIQIENPSPFFANASKNLSLWDASRPTPRRLSFKESVVSLLLCVGFPILPARCPAQMAPSMPVGSMLGCTNPNTNASKPDWGTAESTEYETLTNSTMLIGTPAYTSNAIFWISKETAPGQSVLIAGAFTSSNKSVKVALIPAGTTDWQAVVQNRGKKVNPTQVAQVGTTGLSFVVPDKLPAGVYGFEIDDVKAPSIFGLANVPSMTWAIGIPSNVDATKALQSQVHDCGAEPGETLRIFGKNFVPSSQVILQSSDGTYYPLEVSKGDANSIEALIPSKLNPGTYYAWVGNYPWDAASSTASPITINSPAFSKSIHVTCNTLVGDGTKDNSSLLQSCIDSNARAATSDQLIYLTIPAGTFAFTRGITLRPRVILLGSSPNSTEFIWQTSWPANFIAVSQYAGLANLSLNGPSNSSLVAGSDSTGNPATSGHFYLDNLNITTVGGFQWVNAVALTGPDVQVYNSSFDSEGIANFGLGFGDGGIIAGNTFVDDTALVGVGASQNIIIESNTVYSKAGAHSNPNAFLQLGRGFCALCQSMLSQNIYIGYNTLHDVGGITNDGGGGAYYGPIASSTANTVTLANDPSWVWTGNSNPETIIISIVYGRGAGEYAVLKSWNGRTLTLDSPWVVAPDSSSIAEINSVQRTLTIAHNTFTNVPAMAIQTQGVLDALIEDNELTNSGSGIQVSGYGPYGGPAAFPPMMDSEILRNTIAVGAGDVIVPFPSGWAGIGIFDGYGSVVSGLMVRDNVVPDAQIMWTLGDVGLNAVVVEENIGKWFGSTKVPGLYVWNNANPLP
jgi:hypothetical protein